MKHIALQISPQAKSAYFADYLFVAQQELNIVVGGEVSVELVEKGPLQFFYLKANEADLLLLSRLSFVLGLYEVNGEALIPLDLSPNFALHEDFVFGSKYKGKTNEHLTQMLLNVGLATINKTQVESVSLLDPMCGRGTTLMWAMRYGLTARGIEQDNKALADIQRNTKKWCKLHRQKHKLNEGYLTKANKKRSGQFLQFEAADTSMKVVIGDGAKANEIYKKEKFDLIISDLPYGVQHFTTEKTRNPLVVLEQCVESWAQCLKKGGAIVLAFNSYIPTREEMIKTFTESGQLNVSEYNAAHRMSESIVRDVVVFTK